MTPTWYNTPARIAALVSSALPWEGTPFRENSAALGPGGGVSCHNLVAELYFESGFLPRFAVPTGRARAMVHGAPDGLLHRLDSILGGKLATLDPATEKPLPGDLLIMRMGKTLLHLGTVLPRNQFVHVMRGHGVMLSPLADSTYKIAALRRPKP
jgi:cell wall-associated NlpC family hydrolase